MERIAANGTFALATFSVPLIAEYASATPENVPGTGFSVLLYEPFDFAYLLLVAICFVFINLRKTTKSFSAISINLLVSFGITVLWFVITFLSVGHLHLSLGGKL